VDEVEFLEYFYLGLLEYFTQFDVKICLRYCGVHVQNRVGEGVLHKIRRGR